MLSWKRRIRTRNAGVHRLRIGFNTKATTLRAGPTQRCTYLNLGAFLDVQSRIGLNDAVFVFRQASHSAAFKSSENRLTAATCSSVAGTSKPLPANNACPSRQTR